jgi:succinate---hydroxymethylglutarate CoA-transferase
MPSDLLNGLRILAVEQYGAGPFGSQGLADLGAEVIKIENPREGGDMSRSIGPHFDRRLPQTSQSYFFQSVNRNKKSLGLDLSTHKGQEIFRRLAATADAVSCNLRGDVVPKLGITYAQLSDVNSKIVCAHLTGYGRTGARAAWPGYDYLMQAEAGYFDLTGDAEGPPSRMGLSIVDFMAGTTLAQAVLAGVISARATGQGRDIDVSLYDLAMHNLNYVGHWYLNKGITTTRLSRSAHPVLTPCQSYRTADGWIYLMCNKEKFWAILCAHLGKPEWAVDPAFATFADRLAQRDRITGMLDEALSVKTTSQWLVQFGGSIPAAPILTVAQALDNPFASDHGCIEPISMGEGEVPLRMLANPIRVQSPKQQSRAGPALGADTDSLLHDIGMSKDEITQCREEGIL